MDIENAQIHLSELQEERRKHKIALPGILKNKIVIKENDIILNNNEKELEPYFPNIIKNPLITLEIDNTNLENYNDHSWYQTMSTNISDPISKDNSTSNSFIKEMTNIYNDDDIIKIGILFVGLQAPGGHNVICGTLDYLKKKNKKNILYGFINGFDGINEYNFMELKNEYISMFRNSGGFDMINKGVKNIHENYINIKRCFKICRHLDLNGLIIVGGVDTSKEVAILSEYFEFVHNSVNKQNHDSDVASITDTSNITNKSPSSIFIENQNNEFIDDNTYHQDDTYNIVSDISDEEVKKKYPKKIRRIKKKTKIISVPTSIHNEIKNDKVECSLGFDTTIFTTCQYISYLMSYIQTYKKGYHFVKVIGNKSSHIALECFFQTKANIVLISEEIKKKKMTLNDIVNFITNSIKIRYKNGEKKYGIIIIPEGILKNVQDIKKLVNLCLHFKTEFIKNENAQNETTQNENTQNEKYYNPDLEYLYSPSKQIMNKFKTYIHTNMDKENLDLFQYFPLFFQNQFLAEIFSDNFQYNNLGVEDLLAFLVKKQVEVEIDEIELITHYYGNEVTSALPTNFDCAYSYILGFGCVEMIINKYNGYMCSVTNLKNILSNVNKIKIVGIPIYKFIKIEKKEKINCCENDNYNQLFIKEKNLGIKTKARTKKVSLNDEYFLTYKTLRSKYLESDNYRILSGIQYNYYIKGDNEKLVSYYKSGNKMFTNDNILYKSKMENEICNRINFTIIGIHNDIENCEKKNEIDTHNFDKKNEQNFNCNYYKHLNNLSKVENILTKGIIKFNTNLIRHNTTIQVIENNFGNKINCDTFNNINKITDFYIISENTINTKIMSKEMSKNITNNYHTNYNYMNRNDSIYSSFCKSVGVVMLSHVVPGVNNILVGLHQRLSINNLKLIGFIKGIKGLLNNETCIINDNNIKSSINLGGFPLLGNQISYNTDDNEIVHIYNLFNSDNIDKIIKSCENNKITNLVFIGDEKVISIMNILNEIFIKKNINIKIITVPISIYNSYDKNLIECSIGYHTTVHIISNIVSNIQRCSINLNKYYYFVKIPANISSSLLLSIQLETHCNICCIGEPVVAGHLINLFTIVEHMSLVIIERINRKKNYGVILLTSNLLFCIKEFDDLCKDVDNNVKTEMEVAQIVNQEFVSDQ
ncbi:63231-59202 [Plasmodium yoelii yoelii]|nr:63231-59202 [Plasmodium yoelii yoelii]